MIKKGILLVSTIFLIQLIYFERPLTFAAKHMNYLKVHFIDVGQGDSIFIETPAGKTILIDGGPPEAGNRVVSYLNEQKLKEIDLLISTHPDFDHIGGLIDVIKHFPVKQIIDSGKVHHTKTYRRYMLAIEEKKIPFKVVEKNDRITLDTNVYIDVLNSYRPGRTNNESALAFKMKFKEKQLLLLSDIEKEQEYDLLKQNDLQSHLIKVAHHGSKTSSSQRFLQRVSPNIAILTYDKENEFGHPAANVIKNLMQVDTNIYSTAVFGHMIYMTDGKRYLLQVEKTPLQNILN